MPTSHARIAVMHDDELRRALRIAGQLLPTADQRSQAARVRALAIRGAEALAAERGDDEARIEAALDALGATRPTGTWDDLPPAITIGPLEDRLGTAAVDEVRGPR